MPATSTHAPVRPAALTQRLGVAARLEALRPGAPVRVETTMTGFDAVLRTPRLVLRPLTPRDRGEFLRVLRVSRRHLEASCPLTTDDAGLEPDEAVWERQLMLARRAAETGLAWRRVAVLDPGPGADAGAGRTHGPTYGRIVGAINVNDIARGLEHTGEMVLWVAGDAAGMGLGQEMARALVAHALEDLPRGLGLHRLTALIAPANHACVKLAARSGFRLEAGRPPVALRLGSRAVLHDTWAAYAPVASVGGAAPRGTGGVGGAEGVGGARRVVEGKPSVAESIFGRGLLSILRTEASPEAHPATPNHGR